MIVSVLIAVIVASVLVVLILAMKGGGKKSEKSKDVADKIQKKGKSAIIREAEKKLSHNPRDVPALQLLGDIYYQDGNWEKVMTIYKTLYDMSPAHLEIDVGKASRRLGIALYRLDKVDEALPILVESLKKDSESFETNIYLARALIKKEVYDKAIACLKKCKLTRPDSSEVNALLAECLFKAKKYRDALPFLKRLAEEHPENKENLYNMAVALAECNMNDNATKIFMHLRPDPQFGPQSCLEVGKIHERAKNYQAAVQDYEIAMKLQGVPDQTMIQIKYRCGMVYITMNEISRGLELLKQVQAINANYKDVDALVTRYSELNQNKNLQTYMLGGTSDFVALCRKVIQLCNKDAFVKVEDVAVAAENVEIICIAQANRWEAKQMFRFYRTAAVIGDINVRELHSKMRDVKADNGFCITIGMFSDGAHKFIEGRPINLIEKDQLAQMLKKIK